jgi:hypothetical protein
MKLKPYSLARTKAELLLESIIGPALTESERQGIEKIKNDILSKDFNEQEIKKLEEQDVSVYKEFLSDLVAKEVENPEALKMYQNTIDKEINFDLQTKTELFVKSMLLKGYTALLIKDKNMTINDYINILKEEIYGNKLK